VGQIHGFPARPEVCVRSCTTRPKRFRRLCFSVLSAGLNGHAYLSIPGISRYYIIPLNEITALTIRPRLNRGRLFNAEHCAYFIHTQMISHNTWSQNILYL